MCLIALKPNKFSTCDVFIDPYSERAWLERELSGTNWKQLISAEIAEIEVALFKIDQKTFYRTASEWSFI